MNAVSTSYTGAISLLNTAILSIWGTVTGNAGWWILIATAAILLILLRFLLHRLTKLGHPRDLGDIPDDMILGDIDCDERDRVAGKSFDKERWAHNRGFDSWEKAAPAYGFGDPIKDMAEKKEAELASLERDIRKKREEREYRKNIERIRSQKRTDGLPF